MSALGPPLARPCPMCKASVEWGPASPFRPFCSERCRMLDFGGWMSESYRVAAVEPDDDEDDPADDRGPVP